MLRKMKRTILLFALLLLVIQLPAQVVNTEQKRRNADADGWDGSADLGFSFTQNTKTILQGSSRVNVQMDRKKHMLLLLNDLKMMKVDQTDLQNSGFQHVRYNYKFRKYLIPECFVQAQFNQIWKIDLRFLAGAGPRFELLKNDSTRIFMGALVMYEFEKVDRGAEYHRDFRMSCYGSTGFGIGKGVSLENITYLQPLLKDISDVRLSSETSINTKINKKISFRTTFSLNYDSRPPDGLTDVFYSFINALSYKF